MPLVKCDKCGQSVKVEDSTKKYRLPLFLIFLELTIPAYERNLCNSSIAIMIMGGLSAASGLI